MPDYQLALIRNYCDTTGIRLNSYEKNLLCMILNNPAKFDGFKSELYVKHDSGRDYRDTWTSITKWQYRINIGRQLSIDKIHYHECDGYVQDKNWDWDNAWHITNTREIINILKEIEPELLR